MDNITEEQVTKNILQWLLKHQWKIITYDFPQSGTGKYLHPNKGIRKNQTKNDKAFIPDIVAIKNSHAVFFENKNRFFLDDFIKLKEIKESDNYSLSISNLLKNDKVINIYFGIGAIYNKGFLDASKQYSNFVDFIILYDNVLEDIVVYTDNAKIFG